MPLLYIKSMNKAIFILLLVLQTNQLFGLHQALSTENVSGQSMSLIELQSARKRARSAVYLTYGIPAVLALSTVMLGYVLLKKNNTSQPVIVPESDIEKRAKKALEDHVQSAILQQSSHESVKNALKVGGFLTSAGGLLRSTKALFAQSSLFGIMIKKDTTSILSLQDEMMRKQGEMSEKQKRLHELQECIQETLLKLEADSGVRYEELQKSLADLNAKLEQVMQQQGGLVDSVQTLTEQFSSFQVSTQQNQRTTDEKLDAITTILQNQAANLQSNSSGIFNLSAILKSWGYNISGNSRCSDNSAFGQSTEK